MHSFLLSYTSLFNGFGNRFKNEDMLLIYEWGLKILTHGGGNCED